MRSAAARQYAAGGVVISVQVLLDIGMLSLQDYEQWCMGEVEYLEWVCCGNLY